MPDAKPDYKEAWTEKHEVVERAFKNMQDGRVFYYAFQLANGKSFPPPNFNSRVGNIILNWPTLKPFGGKSVMMHFRSPEAPCIETYNDSVGVDFRTEDLSKLEEMLKEWVLPDPT